MKIKKDELKQILNKLKPVSLKDDLLVENFLGQLIFSEDGISIFNDQTYIFYPIDTNLDCIISYTKLLNFITKTSGKFIKITQTTEKEKKDKIVISCGKAKLSLNPLLLNDMDKKTIGEIRKKFEDGEFDAIPEGFSEGIAACSHSTSTDPADGTKTCICINGDVIIGADNSRVAQYTMESEFPDIEGSVLISSDLSSMVSKFKAIEFKVADAWLIFKDEGDCLLSLRRIRGKYSLNKYKGLFDSFDVGVKIDLPEEINRIVDLINTMVSETNYTDRYLIIKLEDNILLLSSSSESAKIEEKIKVEYKGQSFNFSINPNSLQQALQVVGSNVIEKNKEGRMVRLQTENFKQLIALKMM